MDGKGQEPWQVRESDFPERGSTSDKLHFLLRYAILAPSGHNSQPWLFRVQGDPSTISGQAIELTADTRRDLPVVDPQQRELVISCGAALGFLRIAAHRFGYHAKVEVDIALDSPMAKGLPDPSPRRGEGLGPDAGRGQGLRVARVTFRPGVQPSTDDLTLFKAITLRRTDRSAYDGRPLPEGLLKALVEAAALEGAWLRPVSKGAQRDQVGEVIEQGGRTLAGNPAFRRELVTWIRPNWSGKRDGMPGYAFGAGPLRSLAMPFLIRTFNWGKAQGAAAKALAIAAPEFVVLGTLSDTPQDWLKTGQALARVLLRARAEGVSAHFLNQPVQVPSLRLRLTGLLGRGGHPQLAFRMGFGHESRPTPRRAVDEVLITG